MADQLVFFNKLAFNKRTGDKKFNWAPIERKYSLLPIQEIGEVKYPTSTIS